MNREKFNVAFEEEIRRVVADHLFHRLPWGQLGIGLKLGVDPLEKLRLHRIGQPDTGVPLNEPNFLGAYRITSGMSLLCQGFDEIGKLGRPGPSGGL